MPTVSPSALARSLRDGERGGVYFIHGDEEHLKDEAVARIVEAHLDPGTRDFNFDQLSGNDADAETLASMIQTPPMMAEWRVVLVRDAQGLAGSPRTREAVEAVLERPLPGLALVLVAAIPDRSRAKFYEELKKRAKSVELARLAASDLPGWLIDRASADGVELAPEAARALAAAIGSELGILTRELDKLRDYVGDTRSVSVADVEAVVGAIPRQNRWEWFDLVGARRFRDARESLSVLLDASESGVGLVMGLGTQLLRIGMAVAGGQRALEAELPPHQRWLAGRIGQQARGWTAESIDAALDDLLRADRLLKSTALDDAQILEELLLRLQARAAAPATA